MSLQAPTACAETFGAITTSIRVLAAERRLPAFLRDWADREQDDAQRVLACGGDVQLAHERLGFVLGALRALEAARTTEVAA